VETKNTSNASELHIIRAHLLHYGLLLVDFRKTVEFLFETRNPALELRLEEIKQREADLFKRETNHLLSEIERLERSRQMQDWRLQNVINLVSSPFLRFSFSLVFI
jgi:hypothetical protein